jgi:hypothetical protein
MDSIYRVKATHTPCYFLLLIYLLLPRIGFAQIWDYSYTHFGKADGLPSNTIYAVTMDQQGVLWIGSDAGVTRFDGAHIRNFTTDDGLPSNDVFKLFCDSKNRIWIFGLSPNTAYIEHDKVYNRKNDSLVAQLKLLTTHNNMFEFSNGIKWITTTPKLIYELDGKKVSRFQLEGQIVDNLFIGIQVKDTLYALNPKFFFHVAANRKQESYSVKPNAIPLIGLAKVNDQLFGLQESDGQIVRITLQDLVNGKYKSVRSSWVLHSNSMGDLFQIKSKGILEYTTQHITTPIASYLPNSSVATIFEDPYKNLWLPTLGQGLFLVNYSHAHIYQNTFGETANKFLSFYVTPEYFCLGNDNNELSIVDRKTKKLVFQKQLTNYVPFSNRIMRIIPWGKEHILCSSDLGVYIYSFREKRITPTVVYGSCKNIKLKGDTLIVQNSAGLIYYNLRTHDTSMVHLYKRAYSYMVYNDTEVVGAEDGLYQSNQSTFQEYLKGHEFKYRVMDMMTIDSMLVLATIEKGVVFIKGHKIIRNITKQNGLSHNNCYRLGAYQHKIFVATSNGVSMIDLKNFHTKRIFESDGLASNTVNDIQIENDTLYAATDAGFSVIPIQNIISETGFNLFLRPLIVANDTLWEMETSLKLRTHQRFNVTCNSTSYASKGDIIYFYRIRGVDSNFTGTRDQNISIDFEDPGEYTLDFFGKDANGSISNQVTLRVEVVPYVYQTTWFKFMMSLLGVVIFFVSYRWFLLRIRKREQQKNELTQKIRNLELIAWKSTINPHFLFNSLNTMQSFFSGNDFVKANRFLSQFSTILRKTIDQSSKLMIQIEQEINYLQNYLELEKIKRYDEFSFEILLQDQEIKSYFIPTLVLQPIIENSLKHGIRDNENGHIQIEFAKLNSTIMCTIYDNGRGLPSTADEIANTSKGIKLVRDKIAIIEKMIHQEIPMTMSNRIGENREILGCQTVFSFPIITFDLDDKNSTHR